MEKLSVKEAMEQLHVSETTIRRMIKRGDLPNAYKEDRKIVILQSDIDAYLRQHQQSSEQPETLVEPETPGQLEAPFASPSSQTPDFSVSDPKVKSVPEPEEKPPIKTDLAKVSPSTIAQPIEELDESPESRESEPVVASPEPAYSPGAVPVSRENEQSFKWVLVQAGILGTRWLEEIFRSMRIALEKYKQKAFPGSSDTEE